MVSRLAVRTWKIKLITAQNIAMKWDLLMGCGSSIADVGLSGLDKLELGRYGCREVVWRLWGKR
jgi:hypothetical protein